VEITVAPYGSWSSPISAELITRSTIILDQIAIDGDTVYWSEQRPHEGGRSVLMAWTARAGCRQLTPDGFNVRTRVHEYGGGDFWVANGTVYFVNFDDQRVYRQANGQEPMPLTPDGTALRYADGVVDSIHRRLICVREDHRQVGKEAANTIVAIPLEGGEHDGTPLVEGNDFYASPRLSPDGRHLAWLTWNHPNMPWDGTELWVATLDVNGNLGEPTLIAGGARESIFQPDWSPAGELTFVSDRTGWWNLYRRREGRVEPLRPHPAEFGRPQWRFGMTTYGFTQDGRLIFLYREEGRWQLGIMGGSGEVEPISLPQASLSDIQVGSGFFVVRAGSPDEMPAILRVDLATQQVDVLRRSGELTIDHAFLSRPEPITFPTGDGKEAHAYYYPPQHPSFVGPAGEKPPLLVRSHGGPTSNTEATLSMKTQYWTSRGFAVLDVDYRGSSGYGRAYRQQLYGQWGVVDVTDCIDGARYLVARNLVDGERLAVRGGSAGGYTTLCALAFHDYFDAGASHFGVSDLEALARDTHKFESHYLVNLIGPYPETRDRYRARSPLHHAHNVSCPVIFFQGAEDRVVPPSQAETMVSALRDSGVPVAYFSFREEQHGFRQAATVRRTLEAELSFYGYVFGFEPADLIEAVEIMNMNTSRKRAGWNQ
jgi:dipeptidyl aminopeptidase/acylaminoacyl peptidase